MRTVEGSTMMKAGGSAPSLIPCVQLLSWAKHWSWGAWRGGARSDADMPSAGAVVMGVAAGPRPPLLWHLGHMLAQLSWEDGPPRMAAL